MKSKYFVVNPETKESHGSFPSFSKAKSFQIGKGLMSTTQIWGFDPNEVRKSAKK